MWPYSPLSGKRLSEQHVGRRAAWGKTAMHSHHPEKQLGARPEGMSASASQGHRLHPEWLEPPLQEQRCHLAGAALPETSPKVLSDGCDRTSYL